MMSPSWMCSYHHALLWSTWQFLVRARQILVQCPWSSRSVSSKSPVRNTHLFCCKNREMHQYRVVIFSHWMNKVCTHGNISLERQSKQDNKVQMDLMQSNWNHSTCVQIATPTGPLALSNSPSLTWSVRGVDKGCRRKFCLFSHLWVVTSDEKIRQCTE